MSCLPGCFRCLLGAAFLLAAPFVQAQVPVTLSATVSNPAADVADFFGTAVATSGTRTVVGAPSATFGGTKKGKVFVYDSTSATPTVPVFSMDNPSTTTNTSFGSAVAISGNRVVVGSPVESSQSGRAYVYDLNSASPTTPSLTLSPPNNPLVTHFGWSVAISGSLVAIGMPHGSPGGVVYVYDVSTFSNIPTFTINNSPTNSSDSFGQSVAIDGLRLVVGSPFNDTGATNAGRVFVYHLGSSTPSTALLTLSAPTPAADENFGYAVSIAGKRIAVGAPGSDVGATDAGRGYAFDLSSPTPTVPVATLNNPDPATGDGFGSSVAVSSTHLLMGTPKDDAGAVDAGSVYAFDLRSPTSDVSVAGLSSPSPVAGGKYGTAVAMADNTVVVGTPDDVILGSQKGSARLYDVGFASAPPTIQGRTYDLKTVFEAGGIATGTLTPSSQGTFETKTAIEGFFNASEYSVKSNASTFEFYTENSTWILGIAAAGTSGSIQAGDETLSISLLTPDEGTTASLQLKKDNANGTLTNFWDVVSQSNSGSDSASSTLRVIPYFFPKSLPYATPLVFPTIDAVTGLKGTKATIHASINPEGNATNVWFIFGTDPSLSAGTAVTPTVALGSGTQFVSASHTLSLAPLTTYYYRAAASNAGGTTLGRIRTLATTALDAQESWRQTYFGNPSDDGAGSDTADTDGDGLINLLEYALGMNPTQSDPGNLPAAVDESGYLTMTVTKQPGVTYEVQSAGTLLTGQPDSFSAASTTLITNNATTLKVRDNFLLSTTPNRFMRVKVTAAP